MRRFILVAGLCLMIGVPIAAESSMEIDAGLGQGLFHTDFQNRMAEDDTVDVNAAGGIATGRFTFARGNSMVASYMPVGLRYVHSLSFGAIFVERIQTRYRVSARPEADGVSAANVAGFTYVSTRRSFLEDQRFSQSDTDIGVRLTKIASWLTLSPFVGQRSLAYSFDAFAPYAFILGPASGFGGGNRTLEMSVKAPILGAAFAVDLDQTLGVIGSVSEMHRAEQNGIMFTIIDAPAVRVGNSSTIGPLVADLVMTDYAIHGRGITLGVRFGDVRSTQFKILYRREVYRVSYPKYATLSRTVSGSGVSSTQLLPTDDISDLSTYGAERTFKVGTWLLAVTIPIGLTRD